MDENDYFLREFVKTRIRNHLNKVKLKKVVSDILLAQKVKRFLIGIQNDSKQTTGRPETTISRRRLSVRVVSPRGVRTPKQNASRRNTKSNMSMPEIKVPVLSGSGKSERASRSASKTPVPNIIVSSATRNGKSTKGSALLQEVSQKTSSAKMPRIENRSAGTVSTSIRSLSPSKKNTHPFIRVTLADKLLGNNSAPKPTTSLPALTESMWAGDPKAIGSVRRPRKNAREMLASYKSGEESRRIRRQMTITVPCTRNCHKPDLFSELERMYTELPSLLPAIEKAREDLAMENEDYSAHLRSRDRRASVSLWSIHSQSQSRRNSISASHVSGRRNSGHFESKTLRPHGSSFRQITSGFGTRH